MTLNSIIINDEMIDQKYQPGTAGICIDIWLFISFFFSKIDCYNRWNQPVPSDTSYVFTS